MTLYLLLRRRGIELASRAPAEVRLGHLRSGLRLVEQIEPVTDLTRLQAAKWINETVARGMAELLHDDCHELEASAAADMLNELRGLHEI